MKKILKTVMLAVLAVAMVFGGMAVLDANASNVSIRNCVRSVRDRNNNLLTMQCRLWRDSNDARVNAETTTGGGSNSVNGQLQTTARIMAQPNGTVLVWNTDSWRTTSLSIARASQAPPALHLQVQGAHWYRATSSHSALIVNTVIQANQR